MVPRPELETSPEIYNRVFCDHIGCHLVHLGGMGLFWDGNTGIFEWETGHCLSRHAFLHPVEEGQKKVLTQ